MQFSLKKLPIIALCSTAARQLYVTALPASSVFGATGVAAATAWTSSSTDESCRWNSASSSIAVQRRALSLRGGGSPYSTSAVASSSSSTSSSSASASGSNDGGSGGAPPDLPDIIPTDRSFVALKPDALRRGLIGEIITRLERKGLKLVAMKGLQPGQEQTEQHYAEHLGQNYFPRLVNFFRSGPIIAMVWEGPNAVLNIRRLVGKTHPEEAAAGTIRGDYCFARGENLVHCSDSKSSAEREIAVWFKDADFFAP